jgi:parallel beta-helix repeat protein
MKSQGSRANRLAPLSRTQQLRTAKFPWQLSLAVLLGLTGAIVPLTAQPLDLPAPITAQAPLNARVLYVNPAAGFDGTERGADTTPFRTITYALQLAQPGTIVQLVPGTYSRDTGEVFPLVLRPGVSLRGDSSTKGQTVLIVGSGTYISPTFARQNVTVQALENSELIGVTVTNTSIRGTAVWIEAGNPVIRNSTFSNSLRDGIFVTGTANPRIEGNIFTKNDGNGISIARTAQGEIRGNVFQDTGFGIAVSDSAAPLISDNQIIANVDGVVTSNAARPTLRNNVIENNSRDGLVAIANAQPDLGTAENPGKNVIRNNGRYDVYNATRSNTLLAVGNEIASDRISGSVDFVALNAPPSQFGDVRGHWAQAYIDALATQDIIGGFPDGTFRPNEPVTRAQFAAIVAKAFSPSPKRAAVNFVDVQSDFWGQQAIQVAYQGGFMTGYPGQLFQPGQAIPRVQALASLVSGLGLGSDINASISRYQDAAQIPDWATGAIAAATQNNIVVNYPIATQLNPNQPATRGDVAAFIYQALVKAGRVEAIASPYVVTTPQ